MRTPCGPGIGVRTNRGYALSENHVFMQLNNFKTILYFPRFSMKIIARPMTFFLNSQKFSFILILWTSRHERKIRKWLKTSIIELDRTGWKHNYTIWSVSKKTQWYNWAFLVTFKYQFLHGTHYPYSRMHYPRLSVQASIGRGLSQPYALRNIRVRVKPGFFIC